MFQTSSFDFRHSSQGRFISNYFIPNVTMHKVSQKRKDFFLGKTNFALSERSLSKDSENFTFKSYLNVAVGECEKGEWRCCVVDKEDAKAEEQKQQMAELSCLERTPPGLYSDHLLLGETFQGMDECKCHGSITSGLKSECYDDVNFVHRMRHDDRSHRQCKNFSLNRRNDFITPSSPTLSSSSTPPLFYGCQPSSLSSDDYNEVNDDPTVCSSFGEIGGSNERRLDITAQCSLARFINQPSFFEVSVVLQPSSAVRTCLLWHLSYALCCV